MDVKINGKSLLDRLNAARKDDRKAIALYLSESLYKEFKAVCGILPGSLVVETLIREFVETARRKK